MHTLDVLNAMLAMTAGWFLFMIVLFLLPPIIIYGVVQGIYSLWKLAKKVSSKLSR